MTRRQVSFAAVTCVCFAFMPLFVMGGAGEEQKPKGAKAIYWDSMIAVPVLVITKAPGTPVPQPTETGGSATPPATAPDATTQTAVPPTESAFRAAGIRYWIERLNGQRVTDSEVFKTGDEVYFKVVTNVDGYLSLWSVDPAGRGSLLFPVLGKTEVSNFVNANKEYCPPGTIVFKRPAEDEKLLVFFSQNPRDLPTLHASSTADEMKGLEAKTGGRALVFEEEKQVEKEIGGYVVNQNGGPVLREIRLKHVD